MTRSTSPDAILVPQPGEWHSVDPWEGEELCEWDEQVRSRVSQLLAVGTLEGCLTFLNVKCPLGKMKMVQSGTESLGIIDQGLDVRLPPPFPCGSWPFPYACHYGTFFMLPGYTELFSPHSGFWQVFCCVGNDPNFASTTPHFLSCTFPSLRGDLLVFISA